MSYGKSLALSQNSFVQPPTEDEADRRDSDHDPLSPLSQRSRHANVFDAVAGRVSARGFHAPFPSSTKHRDTAYTSLTPIRPEEVLFRQASAPTRYEENDFYFAHESLPPDCPLPSSGMLEAIHAYTADFYDRTNADRGRTDWKSMDETALIAMGILLEEMAKESLGDTGDMVLVEGEKVADDGFPLPRTGRRKRANDAMSQGMPSSGDDGERRSKKKRVKKRKLNRRARASTTDGDTGDEVI